MDLGGEGRRVECLLICFVVSNGLLQHPEFANIVALHACGSGVGLYCTFMHFFLEALVRMAVAPLHAYSWWVGRQVAA